MVITRKLKLYPPNKAKLDLLDKVALLQSNCVNFWIDRIRETKSTNLKKLGVFYYQAKKYINHASLTQLAEYTAIRIARTAKKRRINTPYMKKKAISVSQVIIDKNNVGVLLGGGRTWFPFHSEEIPKGMIRESKIKKINGAWYCFLAIDIKEPKVKKYKRFLGVDLGLAKIAVTTDNKGKNTNFFRGEQARFIRKKYYGLRKKLRPDIKKGNIYKLLKRLSRKENNWITDMNHKISRKIVNLAKKKKMGISVEKLTGIAERLTFNKKTRRMIKGWSFRQLQYFISYKANLEGLPYVTVDPRETSKRCSKCGYVSRSNRKSQSRFKCNKCGYETNADRNGAINIALRATGLSVYPIVQGQQATAPM
jgi:IS605 OrfB family transposase